MYNSESPSTFFIGCRKKVSLSHAYLVLLYLNMRFFFLWDKGKIFWDTRYFANPKIFIFSGPIRSQVFFFQNQDISMFRKLRPDLNFPLNWRKKDLEEKKTRQKLISLRIRFIDSTTLDILTDFVCSICHPAYTWLNGSTRRISCSLILGCPKIVFFVP